MKEVKVISVGNGSSFLILKGRISTSAHYYVNGNPVDKELNYRDLVIGSKDVLTVKSNTKQLKEYACGDKVMSIEDYRSKPTYFDDDSSDESVLRAIANKKELEGFTAVYIEPEQEKVELVVVGSIPNIKSRFISCSIGGLHDKYPVVYGIDVNRVTINEYNILSEKYSDHANFPEVDRGYLRFTKINNDFIFPDNYPFNQIQKEKYYASLEDCQTEEENIRNKVRKRIQQAIFKDNPTLVKSSYILSQLKLCKKVSSAKAKNEMLNSMIDDMSKYLSAISK